MKHYYAYAILETRLHYRSGSEPIEKRTVIPMSIDVSRSEALEKCYKFAVAIRDHDLVIGAESYEIVEVISGFITFAYVGGAVVASYKYQIGRRIVTA